MKIKNYENYKSIKKNNINKYKNDANFEGISPLVIADYLKFTSTNKIINIKTTTDVNFNFSASSYLFSNDNINIATVYEFWILGTLDRDDGLIFNIGDTIVYENHKYNVKYNLIAIDSQLFYNNITYKIYYNNQITTISGCTQYTKLLLIDYDNNKELNNILNNEYSPGDIISNIFTYNHSLSSSSYYANANDDSDYLYPKNIKITDIKEHGFTVSWDNDFNASSYNLRWKEYNGKNYNYISNIKNTQYTLFSKEEISKNKIYCVSVCSNYNQQSNLLSFYHNDVKVFGYKSKH